MYCRQGTCYPFHNYPLGSILTGPYYPIHSESGSILSSARMRDGVELCHSPPRRFSQPVVHNQESPLVSYASYVCESDRPLLNSRHTQTRLTFPREEEEDRGEGPLPPESRILLNHEIGIYTDSSGLPWVNVGLFRFRFFLASV